MSNKSSDRFCQQWCNLANTPMFSLCSSLNSSRLNEKVSQIPCWCMSDNRPDRFCQQWCTFARKPMFSLSGEFSLFPFYPRQFDTLVIYDIPLDICHFFIGNILSDRKLFFLYPQILFFIY